MKKLKILFIANGGHLYGDNKSLLQTIIAMKDSVTPMVGMVDEGLMADELRKNGIPYSKIRNTMSPHLLKLGEVKLLYQISRFPFYVIRSIITFFQLLKIVRRFQPDIIHSNNSFLYAGNIVSKTKHIPHVWHLREYIDKDHKMQIPREKYFFRNIKSSFCIAVSQGVFQHRHLQYGKDAVIYDGIFSENELLPYQTDKENYFLFSGRLIPTKGLMELVEAFIQFLKIDPSYKLVIAGEGDEDFVQSVKDLINKEGLTSQIEFLGFIKDIRSLMAKAKALIVPSYFEAQGRITAEAMLLGCFVIGKNTAGTKELLENDNSGILYSTHAELVEAMRKVSLFDNDFIAGLNLKAKESALKRYTCEINAKTMIDFYHSTLIN